jgi:hypothetical protein
MLGYLNVLFRAILIAWGLLACYSPDRMGEAGSSPLGGTGGTGGTGGAASPNPFEGVGSLPGDAVEPAGVSASGRGAAVETLPPPANPTGSNERASVGESEAAAARRAVRLPAACLGAPYRASLAADDVTAASYAPSATSPLPDGLKLDGQTGELSGVPAAVGRFAVEVADAEGAPRVLLDVVLEERQDCWLAYLSAADGPARLHFASVFLDPQFDVALPAALEAGQSVLDFEFAPDGRWIAFRVGAESSYHLELYSTALDELGRLSTASTRVPFACPDASPDAGCGVLDYAWSADSRRLAVVLGGTTPEDDLTAIDVERPDAPWPTLGTASFLGGSIPFDYRDQLVWVGSEWLGTMAADPDFPTEPSETLYAAFVADDGRSFERLAPTSATVGRGTLRAVPAGLLVSNEGTRENTLVSFGADLASAGDDTQRGRFGRVAPSGLLLGDASDDARLQVWPLDDAEAAPLESGRDECSDIVAWSSRVEATGLERIACRSDDALTIFD